MTDNEAPKKTETSSKTPKASKIRNFVAPLVAAGLTGAFAFTMMPPVATPERTVTADALEGVDFSHIEDIALGAQDAPVTMIEYASFTCSHCASFANDTFAQLKSDYIDTGKVRFAMREVVTHPAGLWGGLVARCDGGEAFHDVSKDIFAGFDEWTKQDPTDIAVTFRDIGISHGIAPEKIDACLDDEDEAKALVARSQTLGRADGVKGTPSFVINGVLTRNAPYEDLKKVLDEAIEKAG